MKLMFLGAPGAGKGSQASVVSERYNIPSISTGALLRTAMNDKTELGLKAKSFIESGKLVPDEIVVGLIKEKLSSDECKNGYILDGFPRNVSQAEVLDELGISLDAVIDIEVEDDVIVKRMGGRRVCKSCGATYHIVSLPPKVENVCDVCNSELIIRSDDAPETVLNRLKIYHEQTEPLIKFYENKGNMFAVDGSLPFEDVSKLIFEKLDRLEANTW